MTGPNLLLAFGTGAAPRGVMTEGTSPLFSRATRVDRNGRLMA